jgi:hypothetical protein
MANFFYLGAKLACQKMNFPAVQSKKLLFLLLILFVFAACKGRRTSVADPIPPVRSKANRGALIEALRDLKRRASSSDSNMIVDIYSFPIPDSAINLDLDSAFEVVKTKNGGVVTKAMFLSYYDQLQGELGLDEMVRLFKVIDVGGLRTRDSIGYEENPKKDISYELGRLEVSGDTLVDLMYGTSWNSDHKGTEKEEEAADAGAYDHNTYWTFAFDGRKLRLIKMRNAD